MHDLAAFYAIGALEGAERTAFETHLDECAACRAEVAELSPGVEMLALAVAEPAPAELRGRVEAAVDRIAGPGGRADRGRAAEILSPERSTGPRVNRSTGPESGLGLVDLSTC
jgi:anti-sigma factor RsiW